MRGLNKWQKGLGIAAAVMGIAAAMVPGGLVIAGIGLKTALTAGSAASLFWAIKTPGYAPKPKKEGDQ